MRRYQLDSDSLRSRSDKSLFTFLSVDAHLTWQNDKQWDSSVDVIPDLDVSRSIALQYSSHCLKCPTVGFCSSPSLEQWWIYLQVKAKQYALNEKGHYMYNLPQKVTICKFLARSDQVSAAESVASLASKYQMGPREIPSVIASNATAAVADA